MQNPLLQLLAGIGAMTVLGAVFASGDRSLPSTGSTTSQKQALAIHSEPRQNGFAGEETIIARGRSGQFHLQARVNGQDTEFLVDTGADVVALTVADAARLGIHVSREEFQPIVKTASGVGKAAVVRIDRLELGDDEFNDVDAMVAEGLEVNLLGQSVLRRFGKVELRGDRMVIEHR